MNADLFVSRIDIADFRLISKLEIEFDAGTTALVGENNSGKTTVLLALATALGRRKSSLDDLRRQPDGRSVDLARVDVFLSPANGRRFSDEVGQRLQSIHRAPNSGDEIAGFRTELKKSGESAILAERRTFLLPDQGVWIETANPPFSARVLELLEAQLLDATRDLLADMGNKTSSWGRVLSDLKIPDLPDVAEGVPDPLGQRGLETDLASMSSRVRDASPVLKQLHEDLNLMSRSQASVGNVNLVPLPMRIEELAKSTEIVLNQQSSASLPLRFHGSGSRSLASLLVFRTMCRLKVGVDRGICPHSVTLLEEPEAHLHPHAISALVETIESLPGQRIVSTHSATLVAEIAPSSVRLLKRTNTGIDVRRLNTMSDKDIEHFRRFFGRPFGELFFSRLAVLGDGISERNALPGLVAMDLGSDPAGFGISFIDCKSMSNYRDLNPILSALSALGIAWICFADNDDAGRAALSKLNDPLTGSALGESHPNVVLLNGTKQLEQLLVDAGYGDEVSQVARDTGIDAANDDDRLKFLVKHKAWASEVVVTLARLGSKPPPSQLKPLYDLIRNKLEVTRQSSPTSAS